MIRNNALCLALVAGLSGFCSIASAKSPVAEMDSAPVTGAPAAGAMCVASHGWQHQSHSRWPQWQDSVIRSNALVRSETGALYRPLFRPPYGQRRADSGEFFHEQGLRVALWTIDSQDWNAKVDAGQVQGRLLSLMLLWRHGTILFHDIHDKARTALPWVLRQTRGAGVQWLDCRRYPLAD